MSGWDEGAVFYSDQPVYPDEAAVVNRLSAQRKFKEFLRSYSGTSGDDTFLYRESLLQNQKHLQVALEDLQYFDPELAEFIRESPADYLPMLEAAAAELLVGLRTKVVSDNGEMNEPETRDVQVLLTSKELVTSIRSLGAETISKLVKTAGIVISATRTKAKATSITLSCKNCKNVKILPCKPGLGGAIMPRVCDRLTQPGEEACPMDPFIVLPDRSKYVDQQTLKLQENPEDVPTGELPRNITLAIDRTLVQKVAPGTRVTVIGIYSIYQGTGTPARLKGSVAVRQPYLRVVGMEQGTDTFSRSISSFTVEEETSFREFARQPNSYQETCKLIAPSIFGHEDIKKAVACLLFGGSRKRLPDGVRLRGDINVLLLGDPSTAKSQFLKFVEKTAPIAVYTSGKGSSAAGLTASVLRDPNSREFCLEGGAMVLADGGVVCIDEFDKMRPEDRVAIHEAMEQQTISIAKAGITAVLNSRTSVLAAANPPSGRYDDLKTAQDNIDLQATILSRFDLIFIVKDARDPQKDMQIARHILTVHASAGYASRSTDVQEDANWLKRYLEYARSQCKPRLSDTAALTLQNNYVQIRQQVKQQSKETGECPIPITVRQLEAIIRISEALAKMQLSQEATEEHVTEALRLFHVSTLDAARSGITENLTVTPEMRAEIQQIEAQIKRRMGIGTQMSERGLINDLGRIGMEEPMVRRALIIMHQRNEIEYRRERRAIIRKA